MQRHPTLQGAAWAALALSALLLWDASGLDLALARAFGGAQGFPLRDDVFLRRVLHDGAKVLAWLLAVWLCLGLAWPLGPLRQLPFSRRLQLVMSALLAWAIVALLKASSHTSCPWSLLDFGGVARYVSHWQGSWQEDGGGGRCFPAGHATTGFAFVGGYFALRGHWPRLARRWLYTALGAGLVLGLAQQLRGAHFMSHTLWTAWICWMAAWVSDPLFARGTASPIAQATT
jgi:membrane-associated PAP2 superfamily phosphatase